MNQTPLNLLFWILTAFLIVSALEPPFLEKALSLTRGKA